MGTTWTQESSHLESGFSHIRLAVTTASRSRRVLPTTPGNVTFFERDRSGAQGTNPTKLRIGLTRGAPCQAVSGSHFGFGPDLALLDAKILWGRLVSTSGGLTDWPRKGRSLGPRSSPPDQ